MPGVGQKIVTRTLQRYWRMSRGLTMGAQGVVLDPQNRVVLVKLTYRQGWHFPGGGVERNETARTALERELQEEAGVFLEAEPKLFSLYANFAAFPSDHVALFVVRDWRQPVIPAPNREIASCGLFPHDDLPADTIGPVRRRLAEILGGTEPDVNW